MEKEIRTFALTEIRAEADAADQPKITGDAAVYNAISVDLGGFVELIEPGFFEHVLQGDTRALFNHDENYILGRTTSGTLRLLDHEGGLGFQVDPPATATINDLVMVPMRRGDVNQCSFAFTVAPDGDAWHELPSGKWQRTLKRGGCQELYDISVVTYPAYPQTSAQLRDRFEKVRAAGDRGPVAHDLADNLEFADTPAGEAIRKRKIQLRKAELKR